MRIYRGIIEYYIFIEHENNFIDLGRKLEILSKMDIFKKLLFSSCNTSINTNFSRFLRF